MSVHVLLPAGYADQPSGGNVYGRRLVAGLPALGLDVVVHEISGRARQCNLSRPLSTRKVALSSAAGGTDTLLVDGLLGLEHGAELVALAARSRLVLLAHMPFGHDHERALAHAAAAVVTTSGWSRRWFVEHHGVDPARVVVAEPGVEVADPVPGTEPGTRLLSVGAVSAAKGHDVLLEALAQVADLDWTCTILGPLDRDPETVQKLRQQAADAGLTDRVVLTGPVPHERVGAAYAGADLLVHAAQVESYGMVVTEALAHGLPVVAAAAGGVPEAVGHGADGSVPGLLVAPDDPAALAGALRRWLSDGFVRSRLRRAAGLRRLTLPTWGGTCARVAEVLR